MKLRFESQIVSEYAAGVSLLVDLNQIRPDEPVQSVALDGEEIELDEELIKTFQDVVSTMQTEVLPQKKL